MNVLPFENTLAKQQILSYLITIGHSFRFFINGGSFGNIVLKLLVPRPPIGHGVEQSKKWSSCTNLALIIVAADR